MGDGSVSGASLRESAFSGASPGFVLHGLKELRHCRVILESAHPYEDSDQQRGHCWESRAVWRLVSGTPRPENHGLGLESWSCKSD